MIYLLVVDVSSQVAGPGTILGAGALTYHKILIYNTILTCPKQLKSHIDTATKTCGKSSTSQCKHAHSSTSMLHCPHASARETQPSDWVCGTCNTKRHGRAGRRQHRIVRVDGHAQARSGRTTRCFLTCQASAHHCGERGDVRRLIGRAVYNERNPPEDLLQLPSLLSKQVSLNLHRDRAQVRVGSPCRCEQMRGLQQFQHSLGYMLMST